MLVQLVTGGALADEFDASRVSFEPDGWLRVYGPDDWLLWAVGSRVIDSVTTLDDDTDTIVIDVV